MGSFPEFSSPPYSKAFLFGRISLALASAASGQREYF
jgi:hypothetical protein